LTDAFPLAGEKVKLAPFTEADITDEYIGWLNDPVVTRYSNQRFAEHNHESCRRYLETFESSPNLFVSVRRLEDARPIGTMTAYVAPQHGTADMGILIGDRSAWGQGFGQDAWDTLAEFLLAQPGMRKLTCGTLECNTAMIRLAERSGMALDGRRRAQELVDGEPVDVLYFARFR
jgi:[ribosomal protein S5]-alanine N-acetyltransferase